MSVNSRVLVGRHRATVRYVGPVQGQEGLWLGLEWDDASRGKHSGAVEGMQYFQCTKPGAGSFVRAEKVQTQGCSVPEALLARYSNARGELGLEVQDEELYVHTVRQRRVHIQVVGAEKITSQQSQTQRLTSARLVGAGISRVGDAEELAQAAVNLHELDLTGNLVHSWEFVEELVSALPRLRVLNLSDNKLALPRTVDAPTSTNPSPTLQALVLNDCDITWQQVALLEPCLPCLEELHLAGNGIHCLQPVCMAQGTGNAPPQHEAGAGAEGGADTGAGAHVPGFERLKVLSLEDNKLADWQEVSRLSRLPALHTLNISNNPIPSIRCPRPTAHGQPPPPYFASLATLYAAACSLSSWADVDELEQLPALQELRLTGNPLLGQSKTGGRFEIIGRVGRLRMLNGSGVNARERTDAEIRYMQKALSDADGLPDADKAAAIAKAHPRLPELARRHGAVLSTAPRAGSTSSIASSMLEVTLTCVATSTGAKMGSSKKKLPISTTLAALRTLCEKLCKVKAINQRISIRSPDAPFPEEIGTDDEKQTLGQLGVQDGAELFIDEVENVDAMP